MKNIQILILILISNFLFANKSADLGFYAVAIKSNTLVELQIIDIEDESDRVISADGDCLTYIEYNFKCIVLQSSKSNISGVIQLKFSISASSKKSLFLSHSGKEFYLKKGDKFIGLINMHNDTMGFLNRGETIDFAQGLEMYQAAYLINDYLKTKCASNLLIPNDYNWRIFYKSLDRKTNKNKKSAKLMKIIYFNPILKKFVLIKRKKPNYETSEIIDFNYKRDSVNVNFKKRIINIKIRNTIQKLNFKTMNLIPN